MKMTYSIFGVFFLGAMLSTSASAQTYVALVAQAKADLQSAREKIDQLAQISTGYKPCDMSLLELKEKYANWYINEYARAAGDREKVEQVIRSQLNGAMAEVRGKMSKVKREEIQTIAVNGQASRLITIGFDTVVTYLNDLNARFKTCRQDQRDVLMEQQQNPRFNRLHVAHSQIEYVIRQMTTNVNASLRQSSSTYTVSLEKLDCGFDLVLNGEILLGEGKSASRKSIKASLLQPESEVTVVDRDPPTIADRLGKYSVNGARRWVEMYQESISASCATAPWALVNTAEINATSASYVTFASALAVVKQSKKNRAADCYKDICVGDVGFTGEVSGGIGENWRFRRTKVVKMDRNSGDMQLELLDGDNTGSIGTNSLSNFGFGRKVRMLKNLSVGAILTTGNVQAGIGSNWAHQQVEIVEIFTNGFVLLKMKNGPDAGTIGANFYSNFGL